MTRHLPNSARSAGFIAGTLVHTNEGLRPIEEIRVGDRVLSRPANPEQGAAAEYKRVTSTFRFKDRRVVKFSWMQRPEDDLTGAKSHDLQSKFDRVFLTPSHPVWVQGHGWMPVERLHEPGKKRPGLLCAEVWEQALLRLMDGSGCHIGDVNDCFRTDQADLVYTESTNEFLDWGSLWDFKLSPPKLINNQVAFDVEEWVDPETDDPEFFTANVYDIAVEEFHTYYVGELGLWVHHGDCEHSPADLEASRR